jgi:hypothetical protein
MILGFFVAVSLALASSSDVTLVQNRNDGPKADQQFDHPEEDAERAILAGDRSLRGVNRFTTIVPGIVGDAVKLQEKYKIIVFENTSDVIDIDPSAYNNRAERYAFTYNRYIFVKLGCNYKLPFETCTNYP